MGDPKQVNDLTQLSLPVLRSDKLIVGRSGDLNRDDKDFRGRPYPRLKTVIPTSSDFSTWVNQNSSVVTDNEYTMSISRAIQTSSDNLSCRVRTLPGGTYDVRLGILANAAPAFLVSYGIVLRESGTGKLLTSQFGHNTANIALVRWNSPTSFNSIVKEINGRAWRGFMRFLKNGSNVELHYSLDGVYYVLISSVAITTAFTTAPDQWGCYINPFSNTGATLDCRADFLHWSE